MTSQDIKEFAKTLGLDAVGIVPVPLLVPPDTYLQSPLCPLAAGSGLERYDPRSILPSCQSVIVILFPYYTDTTESSNLSLYCRSIDYHLIAPTYMDRIAAYITEKDPTAETKWVIDTSVLADRWLAYQSGLGFFGDNHCFINEKYGSYCFIGSILTSLPLEPDTPQKKECHHCGACATACPGQCFHAGIYDYSTCKSFLTQKKGSLSLPEIEVLRKTSLIFGCDTCQRVCPHNEDISRTPLPQFYEHRLTTLTREDIADLTNRQFKQAYGEYAFAWRGKKQLLRNFDILESRHEGDDGHGDVQEKEDHTAGHEDDR